MKGLRLILLLLLSGCLASGGWESLAWARTETEKTVPGTGVSELSEVDASASEVSEKERVEKIEGIFITATKTPRNPDDIPASITVITAEDIQRQNIQTADQALRQVPGTYVRRGKGWGDTLASVNLRGFPMQNQTRTLVLLDGQDVSTNYTNSFSWVGLIPEDIDRIEVVRGPFSALYGGNAMGGVINVITKKPEKLELTGNFGYGTHNSLTYYLGAGDRLWDKVSVKASYLYRYTGGYPSNLVARTASPGAAVDQTVGWQATKTTTGAPRYIIGDTGKNTYDTHSFGGKLSWDIAPGHKADFNVLLAWNEYGYGAWSTYLRNVADGSKVFTGTAGLLGTGLRFTGLREGTFLSGEGREYSAIYNLATEHRLNDQTLLKFQAGLTDQPHSWYTTPSSTNPATTYNGGPGAVSSSPSKAWNFELQGEYLWGSKQIITGGLVYKTGAAWSKEYNLLDWRNPSSKADMIRFSQGKDRDVAFYLQDEITWHPKFSTVIGGRLDWWQTYGGVYQAIATDPVVYQPSRDKTSFSPKIAFLYRPWDYMSWRASVGTAFRPPNVYELYRTWRSSTGTLYQGNPNLNPETTLSWEIGTTIKPFTGTVFTATFFDNYVDDLIYRVPDPTDPLGRDQIYANAAKARILGVEMELTQKVNSWLDLFGNMTLVDPRIKKNPNNPQSEGKNITYVPRQQFNFGLNANYWIFNANLTGRYVSKIYARDDNWDINRGVYGGYDPFFTMDTKISAQPVKHLRLSFAVDNILNREYFYFYQTPGRTYWFEVTARY